MGRPRGARSEGYEKRRAEIVGHLTRRLSQENAMHASFRDLAEAAGVSISTLQHYFGRRAEIVAEVLREAHSRAAPFLAHMREPATDLETSVTEALNYIRTGFEHFGLDDLHALGLAEGLRNREIGPVFVDEVLEPSIEALAARLRAHQQRGQMNSDEDPRLAALLLISPLIVAFLHQKDLSGRQKHATDLTELLRMHARAFVAAHGSRFESHIETGIKTTQKGIRRGLKKSVGR
jgi:AcrR family transcriptional regulator